MSLSSRASLVFLIFIVAFMNTVECSWLNKISGLFAAPNSGSNVVNDPSSKNVNTGAKIEAISKSTASKPVDAAVNAHNHAVDVKIDEAKTLLSSGRVKDASFVLLSVLEENPDLFLPNSLLGSCYLALGRPDLAESFLYSAVTLSKWTDVVSVANLAESLRLNKDLSLSMQVAIKGYELMGSEDKSGLLEYVLGATHADQGKYALAADWFLSAALHQPKNIEAWLLASTMKFPASAREYKLAENVLSQAIQSNGNEVELVYHLGQVMQATNRLEQALTCYKFVAQNSPNHRNGLASLAAVQHQVGLANDAFESYQKALTVDSENPTLLNNFAVLLYENKRCGDARILAQKAVTLDSSLQQARQIVSLCTPL